MPTPNYCLKSCGPKLLPHFCGMWCKNHLLKTETLHPESPFRILMPFIVGHVFMLNHYVFIGHWQCFSLQCKEYADFCHHYCILYTLMLLCWFYSCQSMSGISVSGTSCVFQVLSVVSP